MYTKAMNKKQIHKTIQYIICVVFLLTSVMLTGCGKETVDDGMTYFHHSIADRSRHAGDTKGRGLSYYGDRSDRRKFAPLPLYEWNGVSLLLWSRHTVLRQIWKSVYVGGIFPGGSCDHRGTDGGWNIIRDTVVG